MLAISVHRVACWLSCAMVTTLLSGCTSEKVGPLLSYREVPAPPFPVTAKLIEFGSDAPSGAEGARALEARWSAPNPPPFDGVVVDIGLAESTWSALPLAEGQFTQSVNAFATLAARPTFENYQRLNVTGGIDWFDDAAVSVAIANVLVAARLASTAHLVGFFLDVQPYKSPLWAYAGGTHTFEEAESQVLAIGQRFGEALLTADASTRVVTIVSSSEVFRYVCIAGGDLNADAYALLPSFLDGLKTSFRLRGREDIVDGFLASYNVKDPLAFRMFAHLIHGDALGLSHDWVKGTSSFRYPETSVQWPDRAVNVCDAARTQSLLRPYRAGFGVMLDYNYWTLGPFNTSSFENNYFSPLQLEQSLRAALQSADSVVWLWNEEMDWWGTRPGLAPVPTAYLEAVRHARAP